MELTYHLSEIKKVAEQLWLEGKEKKVWAFDAPMGAGKTTLIHALCEVLQISDAVSSPTFAIINEYKSPVAGTVFHMDWYRMKDETEAIQAGCEDCIYSGNLCLIEWPQKAAAILPFNTFHIFIEIINDKNRRLLTKSAQTLSIVEH